MKWIKASERLPEIIGMIFIRNVETKHGGMIDAEELKRLGDLQNVEWLDESPSGEGDAVDFAAYLTGHDVATCKQMYNDYQINKQ